MINNLRLSTESRSEGDLTLCSGLDGRPTGLGIGYASFPTARMYWK